jgi:hypothetical protein
MVTPADAVAVSETMKLTTASVTTVADTTAATASNSNASKVEISSGQGQDRLDLMESDEKPRPMRNATMTSLLKPIGPLTPAATVKTNSAESSSRPLYLLTPKTRARKEGTATATEYETDFTSEMTMQSKLVSDSSAEAPVTTAPSSRRGRFNGLLEARQMQDAADPEPELEAMPILNKLVAG